MAVDIFLLLSNGVRGEAQDAIYPGEIDVLGWGWGMTQSGTTHMGSGGGGGKVDVQDMSITKYVDLASNDLIKKCMDGTHFEHAKLIVRKAGGETGPVEYYQVNMEKVMVTSYQTGGAKDGLDRIQESLTMNFARVEIVYKMQEEAGIGGAASTAAWDIASSEEWMGGPGEEKFA